MKEYKTTQIDNSRIHSYDLDRILNENAKDGWILEHILNNQLIWSRETDERLKTQNKPNTFVVRSREGEK